MICKALILLVLVSYAVSNSCVRFTFEDNEWLTNAWQDCFSMPFWVIGKYRNLDLTPPNVDSTSYIKPLSDTSCITSFMFTMNFGGTIEVNIFMNASVSSENYIIVMVNEKTSFGDWVTGIATIFSLDPDFVSGWQTVRIPLTGSAIYDGNIMIMGSASTDSIVLVDSFRYIPPGMDERDCILYGDHARNYHSSA